MFRLKNFMGKMVLKSSLLEGDNSVTAFFTTRDLPLKAADRDDLIAAVEDNKKLVCKGLNISEQNLIIPVQTHSDNVEVVDLKKQFYPDCDALITNKIGVALALNFADCVPIILYDPVKKVIGCAHAGWRGTVAKIGPKTVQKMVEEFSCRPENIIALIGPAIGKCCFEAGEDVIQQLASTLLPQHMVPSANGPEGYPDLFFVNKDKHYADLKLINKFQLLATGVEKIDVSEDCTSCESGLFFSYRREKGKTARHSAVIVLN